MKFLFNCEDHEWDSFRQQHVADCNHDVCKRRRENKSVIELDWCHVKPAQRNWKKRQKIFWIFNCWSSWKLSLWPSKVNQFASESRNEMKLLIPRKYLGFIDAVKCWQMYSIVAKRHVWPTPWFLLLYFPVDWCWRENVWNFMSNVVTLVLAFNLNHQTESIMSMERKRKVKTYMRLTFESLKVDQFSFKCCLRHNF